VSRIPSHVQVQIQALSGAGFPRPDFAAAKTTSGMACHAKATIFL
jgi:hypothetical protein